jgi:hypothetical protein
MGSLESVTGHIFKALGKAIVNVLLSFIVCLIIGFGAAAGALYFRTTPHHLGTLSLIAAALVGVLAGYAGAVTALLVAAVKEAIAVARAAVGEARQTVGEVEHGFGATINAVEHRKQ